MRSLATTVLLGWLVAPTGLTDEIVRLTDEHADIKIAYQPTNETNKLVIVIHDEDRRRLYQSNEVALVVAEVGKLTLPGDYPPLGSAGEALWVLPQTQDPQLLYLGLSTEDDPPGSLPPGVFSGQLTLRLLAVAGPGHFFVWQAGTFGGLDVRMNSRDGISEADRTPLTIGAHEHFNYGFTANGVYHLVWQVEGRRTGVATNDFSLPTPLRFEVAPLPPPPETPFVRWQQAHWPGVTDPTIVGPEADPDGDRRPNRLEYAYAFDPKTPDEDGTPGVKLVANGPSRAAEVTFRRNQSATDLAIRLEAGPAVNGPWTEVTSVSRVEPHGLYDRVTFRDGLPVDAAAARFYRLSIQIVP